MQFSKSALSLRSSAIRDLLSLATRPDIISFAGGMPGNELFPCNAVREMMSEISDEELQVALQYGPTPGLPQTLDAVREWLRGKGFPVDSNRLIITTSSLQAINMLGKIFLDPDDIIVTENPVFIGATSAFMSHQGRLVGVKLDAHGISIEDLKEALKLKPKFVYITPNFHNPAGVSYSKERRQQFLDVIKESGVLVLEDDAYGELYFDDETRENNVPLKVMAENEQQIMYVGSFSKIFAPGLRVGYILMPEEIFKKVEIVKQSIDACTPGLSQVLLTKFITSGRMESYVAELRDIYRMRRDCMVDAISRYLPSSMSYVMPKGGFYLWLKLPEGVDEVDLLKAAIDKGVVFVIGSTFSPTNSKNGYMRLSFSNTDEHQIEEGIRLLGDAVAEFVQR